MTLEQIAALPVHLLAERHSRLFLWTTNRYLPDAFGVLAAWGFAYRQTLVWHKIDTNLVGSVAPNSAEFLLVGVRGSPGRSAAFPSAVIATPHGRAHSAKPEAWLDHIEAVSPGPFLEMFSRRARFGWDAWGDEAIETFALQPRLPFALTR